MAVGDVVRIKREYFVRSYFSVNPISGVRRTIRSNDKVYGRVVEWPEKFGEQSQESIGRGIVAVRLYGDFVMVGADEVWNSSMTLGKTTVTIGPEDVVDETRVTWIVSRGSASKIGHAPGGVTIQESDFLTDGSIIVSTDGQLDFVYWGEGGAT